MSPPPAEAPVRATTERSPATVIITLALLLSASLAAVVLTRIEAGAAQWVSHTLEVQEANLKLLTRVQDAVLSERGYLITHDQRYLDGYRAAKASIAPQESRLRGLLEDNPAQLARSDELIGLAAAKLSQLDSTIALARAGRQDAVAQAVREHLSYDISYRLRVEADAIDAEEGRLLGQRAASMVLYRRLLLAATAGSIAAWFALVAVVVRDDRRNFGRLRERNAALAAEIERRELAEAQLRQAQKMEAVGQLTGGIAHDFNNMLQIIIANLDMLLRKLAPGDQTRTYVDQALEGARRAASLTKSLLAFSRQQPLEPRSVDVNRVVADMSQLLRGALGEPVTIETVQAGGLWPAFIDRAQFESALLNLAVNARDAMPSGGKLTIETANAYLDEAYAAAEGSILPGQYVLVALTDTGSGMPAEVLAKVFDPFFTTKGPGAGTGLGLSQVHGFIKQSGGHVKLYTEVGVGTTVKLYLPRARSDRHVEEPHGKSAPSLQPPAGTVVLVVEDDVLVRTVAAEGLRDLGYEVIESGGVEEALRLIDSRPEIGLLLTDVIMPGANGRVLAEAVRERRPHLPVVFMTGYTRNAIVHNGVVDQGAFLISKPFTPAQLGAKLQEALAAAVERDKLPTGAGRQEP